MLAQNPVSRHKRLLKRERTDLGLFLFQVRQSNPVYTALMAERLQPKVGEHINLIYCRGRNNNIVPS